MSHGQTKLPSAAERVLDKLAAHAATMAVTIAVIRILANVAIRSGWSRKTFVVFVADLSRDIYDSESQGTNKSPGPVEVARAGRS
jgi:hypothetical protein